MVKLPQKKISKFYYKKRAQFCNDDIKCCAQKRLGRELISRDTQELKKCATVNKNDKLYPVKAEGALDCVDVCTTHKKLDRLEKVFLKLPSVDEIARYKIVYTFIQDLRHITKDNTFHIGNIVDASSILFNP